MYHFVSGTPEAAWVAVSRQKHEKTLWEIAPIVGLLLLARLVRAATSTPRLRRPKQANAPSLTVTTRVPASPIPPAESKATPPEVASASSQNDPVPELIAQVEKEYQAGQNNYKAGHMEAAKQNFDRAFDLLLSGPVDVPSDDRLRQGI